MVHSLQEIQFPDKQGPPIGEECCCRTCPRRWLTPTGARFLESEAP